jgi:hypothetical protein
MIKYPKFYKNETLLAALYDKKFKVPKQTLILKHIQMDRVK